MIQNRSVRTWTQDDWLCLLILSPMALYWLHGILPRVLAFVTTH